jgi:HD superfamily phosphodiesterase
MNDIIQDAENYISDLYKKKMSKELTFHNLKHIKRTVNAANLLAENSGLTQHEIEILNIAAWFHDVGHIQVYEDHEEKSAQMAKQFLQENNYPSDKIDKILGCIRATRLAAEPTNFLEKIMRDADIIHLGKKSYFKRNKELRKEWHDVLGEEYSDEKWIENNIKFFQEHEFQTEYALSKFNQQRLINLAALQEKLDRKNKSTGEIMKSESIPDQLAKKVKAVKTPDRGVETMFRLTSKNHFTLSSIADSKASTLISISALIISIILSVLVGKLTEEPNLILPTVFILITLLGTIVFAVLSTRPKVTSFRLTREDISEKKGNLLFFGNFINMPVEEYEWSMQEVMNDRDYLYNNIIRDIYYLGVVLGKKYRYLRIAYNVFMYGLILSVVTYIIAFAL